MEKCSNDKKEIMNEMTYENGFDVLFGSPHKVVFELINSIFNVEIVT